MIPNFKKLLEYRDLLTLPKSRDDEDFTIFIEKIFDDYLAFIQEFGEALEISANNKQLILLQFEAIKESLDCYYKGHISESYLKFKNCLDSIKDNLPFTVNDLPGLDNFYRVRIGTNYNYSREDMFHIPFEMREKVASQRYSIPGLPCIYLGNSIYVCWEEMGRPDINLMHVSRFDLSEGNFKFLAFGISISVGNDVFHFIERSDEERCEKSKEYIISNLNQFLVIWPLLACCSIKVKNNQFTFKPEYIFPQLLLQWISTNPELGIEGVQYFSNRVPSSEMFYHLVSNYVIPIQKAEKVGHCPILKKRIKLTNPISWQIIDIMNDTKIVDPQENILDELQGNRKAGLVNIFINGHIELLDGSKTLYFNTKFGLMEQKLHKMKADYIK